MEIDKKMQFKKLFIIEYFDCCFYDAVIMDLKTQLFYPAIFMHQRTGDTVTHELYRLGQPISCEQIRALAAKSLYRRAKPYLNITDENWKEIIFGA